MEPIKHEIIGREVDKQLSPQLVTLRSFVLQESVERRVQHLTVASDHRVDEGGSLWGALREVAGCQGGILVVPWLLSIGYELPEVLLCVRGKELPLFQEHHRVQSLVAETNTYSRVGQVGGLVSEVLYIVNMRQALGLSALAVSPWTKSGREE